MLLKKGDKSDLVKQWQLFLISQGFNLAADGDFGPATETSTKAFQVTHDLRPDAMVGDNTVATAKTLGFAGFTDVPVNGTPPGKLAQVHPTLATRVLHLIDLAHTDGSELTVTQGLRTFAEQNALYSQGRTRKGPIVTNARGGESNHNYGLAVDVGFMVNGQISWEDRLYLRIGKWAKQANLNWGGDWKKFKDLPHLELPNIPKWPLLLAKYNAGGLPAVWKDF